MKNRTIYSTYVVPCGKEHSNKQWGLRRKAEKWMSGEEWMNEHPVQRPEARAYKEQQNQESHNFSQTSSVPIPV